MVSKERANKHYKRIAGTNINRYNLEEDFRLESLKKTSRKQEEEEIKKEFKTIDTDHSGYIDTKELKKGLKTYGINMSINATKKIFNRYDNYPDKKIELKEFVQLKRDIDNKDFRKKNLTTKLNLRKIKNNSNTKKKRDRKNKKRRKNNPRKNNPRKSKNTR